VRPRNAADPARERKFDRPRGQTRDRVSESRPKDRGSRSEFKSSHPRARACDSDRPRSRGADSGGESGPPRGRSSPQGRPRPPGKGPPKGPGGGSRPQPRKP
jgi:hypothetical protein